MRMVDIMKKTNFEQLTKAVAEMSERSAWARGVKQYARELLEQVAEAINGGYFADEDIKAPRLFHKQLLNGAQDWNESSWGGCFLIYDGEIAERLCNPSELKKTRNGERRPNAREEWLDTQARALGQAARALERAAEKIVICL